jgi:hypothetical protein
MHDYQQHPLSMRFTPMAESDFRKLCADILADGLLVPIVLFGGLILDGWHRYRACLETGVTPRFENFTGDLAAAFRYVRSVNERRRQASQSQKAMTAAEFATLPHGGQGKTAEEQKLALPRMKIQEASDAFGVSTAYIKDARVVLNSGDPDLITVVKNGQTLVTYAAKQVRARTPKKVRAKKTIHNLENPAPISSSVYNRGEPEGGSTLASGVGDEPSNGDQRGASPLVEGPDQIPTLSTSEGWALQRNRQI